MVLVMCTHMAVSPIPWLIFRNVSINGIKQSKEERLQWVLPSSEQKLGLVDVVKVCPHSKRSLRDGRLYTRNMEQMVELKSNKTKRQTTKKPSIQLKRTSELNFEKKQNSVH